MKHSTKKMAFTAALLGLVPVMAQADGYSTAVPQTAVVVPEVETTRSFPAIFGAASAIPAPGGTGFVALNYVNPRGGISGSNSDGDLSLGYTIGNPVETVSATFQVTLLSLDPLGEDGEFSFSLSRMLRAGGNSATFIGASVGSLHGWGDAADNDTTYSVYGSHLVSLDTANGEIPVQVTLGWGNETTLSTDGAGTVGEGLFYGVGVGVTEGLSLSVSGTETQANLGANLSVSQVPGLGLTAGFYDVFDNTERQQFSFGVAFSF